MWACVLFLCIDILLQFRDCSRLSGLTQQRIKQIEIHASVVYFWLTYFIYCWVNKQAQVLVRFLFLEKKIYQNLIVVK